MLPPFGLDESAVRRDERDSDQPTWRRTVPGPRLEQRRLDGSCPAVDALVPAPPARGGGEPAVEPLVAPPARLPGLPRDLAVSRVDDGDGAYLVFTYRGEAPPSRLAPAEREVVRALLAGDKNADIANRRGRAVRTVANQVASVFSKLGVRSRGELAARWFRGDWGD